MNIITQYTLAHTRTQEPEAFRRSRLLRCFVTAQPLPQIASIEVFFALMRNCTFREPDVIRVEDNGFLVPIILDEGTESYADREPQKIALHRV